MGGYDSGVRHPRQEPSADADERSSAVRRPGQESEQAVAGNRSSSWNVLLRAVEPCLSRCKREPPVKMKGSKRAVSTRLPFTTITSQFSSRPDGARSKSPFASKIPSVARFSQLPENKTSGRQQGQCPMVEVEPWGTSRQAVSRVDSSVSDPWPEDGSVSRQPAVFADAHAVRDN